LKPSTSSFEKIHDVVLLLGIFRRAPRPAATWVRPCAHLLPRGALPLKKNLRSLDIPALLKSWQKHEHVYKEININTSVNPQIWQPKNVMLCRNHKFGIQLT
jgi:hypothetical protein